MIYLDLDGVFADFNKKAIELIGPNYKEIKANELWKELGKEKHLFLNLDEVPDAQSLFRSIMIIAKEYNQEVAFLTALPYSTGNLSTSKQDKIDWVRKHLSKDIFVHTIIGGINKAKFAKPKDILIDDTERNLVAWQSVGAIPILHQTNHSEPTILRLREVLEGRSL